MRRFGARIRVEYLDVRAAAATGPRSRVGCVVAKYSHTAVERNRLKRRLRELVRTRLLPALRDAAPPTSVGDVARQPVTVRLDVLLRALPAAYGASFAALATQVDRVCADVRRRSAWRGDRAPEGREP